MQVTRNVARMRGGLGFEQLEDRRLLSAWQNATSPLDVDASGLVSPRDVLLIVNELTRTGARQLPSDPSTTAPPPYLDVNADGWMTALDALLVVNALTQSTAPLNLALSIAPTDDPNSNGVVLREHVELRGETARQARVRVTIAALDATLAEVPDRQHTTELRADDTGRFTLRADLFFGLNLVTAVSTDMLGRQVAVSREIVRGDLVADWNAAILNVIRDWTGLSDDPYPRRIVPPAPPVVARALAMIHVAMFDALNGVADQYTPYLAIRTADSETSPAAAAATAAFEVARALYPEAKEGAVWNASLAESLGIVPDGPDRDRGMQYGREIAAALLAQRAGDGSDGKVDYVPTVAPGRWARTTPDLLPPLVPHWGRVRPLAVEDVTAFRPDAPPPLTSSAYAEAVDEVMRLGRMDSSERTAEQTDIALFWSDGGGTATPPGHWNRIATGVSLALNESSLERARMLALVNLALVDAGIAAWDAKYTDDLWRPIDAIRRANEDGNAATVSAANWLPLLRTPPFPSYTSGHSTFSGAAASVLTALYGDRVAFGSREDGHVGLTQRPLGSIMTRHFESFWEAAEEAGMSRIYGGIHFAFDNSAGLAAGSAIGSDVVTNWLK